MKERAKVDGKVSTTSVLPESAVATIWDSRSNRFCWFEASNRLERKVVDY